MVPNKFPTIPTTRKLALIGEAPGADEEKLGQPFIGVSGRFLSALLSRAGMSREMCFLGNVSQHRPANNDFSLFSWDGLEVQHGLEKLREDIAQFNPNIVVLLGNMPLKAAKDVTGPNTKKLRFSVSNWRGSLFRCEDEDSPFFGYKCMATYHPSYCLRDYEATPMLQFDLRKAVREAAFPQLQLPKRLLLVDGNEDQIISALQNVRKERKLVALDIEGGIDTMSCISFATSHEVAFIVPIIKGNEIAITPRLWRELALTLEDPNVPKVLQNSLYDRFVLHYSYGIRVRGVIHDTMLKHWELYSELEKSLGVQASLYTDEPYYKFERKSDDDETFFKYCCKDSAVTLEINNHLENLIKGTSKTHYDMNVAMLNPMLYMELRGIRYDVLGAKLRRDVLRRKLFEAQAQLNGLANAGFSWKNLLEVQTRANSLMLTKKGDRCRKEYIQPYERLKSLLRETSPDLATIGEIEDLCEVSLNVNSNKQFIPFLYETLKLPTQFTQKRGEEPRPTADYEALLKLSRECQKKENDERLPVIQKAIEIRALGTREGMLSISADKDGRIRCGYNIVGSNTGRVTCYESPTGSGYNLQTIPNYTNINESPGGILGDRDLFLADEGYWFFQCDLAGADGWTVAAYSAMLGDSTLLDDYRYGLKPARVLACIVRGYATEFSSREQLKEVGKKISKDDWDYFACKRVQHGCSYLEGALTVSRNILKDSEGKLAMSVPECEKLKTAFFTRYRGIRLWHNWIEARLKEKPVLTAASGQVRQFFGRPDEILTKAVAFEPQANTTYATNLAMFRLWTDSENRLSEVPKPVYGAVGQKRQKLRIEPLHQVHDALCGQFRKEDTSWASGKIKSYFDNPLIIAGQQITIPYEGGYGRSWGQLEEGKL